MLWEWNFWAVVTSDDGLSKSSDGCLNGQQRISQMQVVLGQNNIRFDTCSIIKNILSYSRRKNIECIICAIYVHMKMYLRMTFCSEVNTLNKEKTNKKSISLLRNQESSEISAIIFFKANAILLF